MNKTSIEVTAPAKLNLTFEVLGLLDDGYHEVRSLMAAIDLSDTLTFTFAPSREPAINIAIANNLGAIQKDSFPLGSDNLIAKAIRLYLSAIEKPISLKIDVSIVKKIPIGAGMAGGSANAAATLLAMNQYFKGELAWAQLHELAAKLGADVPFCLAGGLRVGTGRGDILSDKLSSEKSLALVIAKPRNLSIATPWVYGAFDECPEIFHLAEKLRDRYMTDTLPCDFVSQSLAQGNLLEALKAFGNDFEQVVFPHYQELKDIKQTFIKLGAMGCHMTGSGPTIFAVTADREAAEKLKSDFYENYCQVNEIACATKYDPIDLWVASTIESGAQVLEVKSES
jgi:4-diphosphocytidyl-2-C-methyl-D-erythritol kinase